jgi:hypothetical protein
MMRRRKTKTYHELEFANVYLTPPERMKPEFKEDLVAMWSEVLFEILDEA